MVRRKRLSRVKPFKVFIRDRYAGRVHSAEEYDELLKKVDRKKEKVRLMI